MNATLGSRVSLLCEASGVPVPSVSWLKDGTAIGESRLTGGKAELGVTELCLPGREQPAVAVERPRESSGAGASYSVSRRDVHVCGQEQRGANAEGLQSDSAR